MPGLLSSVRVLDLSQYVAGPFATKLLADYGAEVVKVERPGCGDGARAMGPFRQGIEDGDTGAVFLYLNTNKKSITLNLRSEAGRRLFNRLAADADVVVENFKPGTLERWGLGYDALSRLNPRLVMTSVTNFGQTGPYRDFEAAHLNLAAISGWMHLLGDPDREPLQAGNDYYLHIAGVVAAAATVTALLGARTTGQGRHVDVSVFEAAASTIPYHNLNHSFARALTGKPSTWPSRRVGNLFPGIVRCKDGFVAINLLTQVHWEQLCAMTGKQSLLQDPLYAMSEDRGERVPALRQMFNPWFAERLREEVYALATRFRVPCAYINGPAELLETPPLKERGFFAQQQHPRLGNLTLPGAPFRPAKTPWRGTTCAPSLGQHNREVFGDWLQITPKELARLEAEGVV